MYCGTRLRREDNHTMISRLFLGVCARLVLLHQKAARQLTVVPGVGDGAFRFRLHPFCSVVIVTGGRQPLFHVYAGKAVADTLGRRSRHDSIA